MTREIPLTQGRVALVDDADYEWLSQWKWCYSKANDYKGYAIRSVYVNGKGGRISMHRFIMQADHESVVDHQDGNGLNNTRSNLRICTRQQNAMNMRKQANTTSRYKGVYLFQGRWVARILVSKKLTYLGTFDDEIEAANAYNTAATEHFGQYAHLNDLTNPMLPREFHNKVVSHLTWLELAN